MKKRILIIGAGITGLYTALRLMQEGHEVILCEREAGLRHEGGGLGIWPTGVKLLSSLFTHEKLTQMSGGLDKLIVGVNNDPDIAQVPMNIFENINGLLNRFIVRGELQENLASLIPDNTILFNKKCCGVEGNSAIFTDGSKIEADCIIASDGIFSAVRQHLFPDYSLKNTGIVIAGGIIDFEEDNYQPKNNFTFGLNRLSMLMPVGKKRYYTFLARPFDGQELGVNLFAGWSHEVDKILNKLQDSLSHPDRKQHYFCQRIWTADPYPIWFNDRVVLLGESAHPISPLLGLGTSLCMQGAESLIDSMNKYPNDLPKAFGEYQAIQTHRLQPLLALENADCERLVDPSQETFDAFIHTVKTTDPAVLFAPLIQALSHRLNGL